MEEPVCAGRRPVSMTLKPGKYFWCACGKAKNQPFCDGSHAGSGFRPVMFEVTEENTAALCLCKKTKTPGFCDGAHRTLPS